jgi:hypothetical protein
LEEEDLPFPSSANIPNPTSQKQPKPSLIKMQLRRFFYHTIGKSSLNKSIFQAQVNSK